MLEFACVFVENARNLQSKQKKVIDEEIQVLHVKCFSMDFFVCHVNICNTLVILLRVSFIDVQSYLTCYFASVVSLAVVISASSI